LTLHAHLFGPQQRAVHFPAMHSSMGSGDEDAISLNWTVDQPHPFSSPVLFPAEATLLDVPDKVVAFILPPSLHSHDPPFVASASPRSPPA
jgi:hypothetical protein